MRVIAFIGVFLAAFLADAMLQRAMAQVVSDGTTNTTVNPNGNNFTIINGIEKGNNLFHSFSNFSVPTGGSARFDLSNTPNITTIFSRVTNGNVSNIDGLIQTLNGNNPVSLFLMNPNGIAFGPNASLNIGGSFVGTTASSIKFADGTELSTVNPTANPLLTISVPVGLGLGSNPGAIQVQGRGHQLTGGLFTPTIGDNTQSTLEVNSGKLIALVGQNVTLSGGVLIAENGRIELGGVKAGTVNINYTSSDFQLDYAKIESFGDIRLVNKSLVDASGLTSRGIRLQGRNISFKDGSTALIQTIGSQAPNSIQIRAIDSLDISGDVRNAPDVGIVTGVFSSRLMSETLGKGNGADIDVSAKDLRLNDGGLLTAINYGSASGGSIHVNVTGDIQINSAAPLNPSLTSGVATVPYSSGQSGNINIIASNIMITDGGLINAINFGQGDSGNVYINISETVEIKGIEPRNLGASNIGSSVFREGNGGSVNLNTSRLIVENGAAVSSSSRNRGNGGKITINASESIKVRGSSPNGELASRITASSEILPSAFRRRLGLPDRPSGNAGSLIIDTPTLQIDNGGRVAVNNEGSGNGGNLSINANSLRLDNKGQLITNTASGTGGDINLDIQSDLILRNNSLISTESRGTGNGGNITINSSTIVGLDNSDIIANAFQGRGGNIDITTQGIFGLKFRSELTEESDITASSEFGINGVVNITTPEIKQDNSLAEQASNFVSKDNNVVASSCLSSRNAERGRFVVTGNGGLLENPNDILGLTYELLQVQTVNTRNTTTPQNITPRPWKIGDPIVEAQDLQVINGKVLLTTASGGGSISQASDLTCDLDLEAGKRN